ncbi:MAG TPA: Crp/Fnr family transcriptional regulator [Arachidicoccus sp.]
MHELIVSNFAMHVNLNTEETMHVLTKLQFKNVKKHTMLLHSGKICRHIYFVNKGCLRIFHQDQNQKEHNILFCPENWWAVDIVSFSEQQPSFYSIATLENSEVFYFSFDALEHLYCEIPKMERFFRILLQNGFNLYQQRIMSNLAKTAEERYELFRRQHPGLEQRITQKHIASYLEITPVFLSLIRKNKFRDQ